MDVITAGGASEINSGSWPRRLPWSARKAAGGCYEAAPVRPPIARMANGRAARGRPSTRRSPSGLASTGRWSVVVGTTEQRIGVTGGVERAFELSGEVTVDQTVGELTICLSEARGSGRRRRRRSSSSSSPRLTFTILPQSGRQRVTSRRGPAPRRLNQVSVRLPSLGIWRGSHLVTLMSDRDNARLARARSSTMPPVAIGSTTAALILRDHVLPVRGP